MNRHNDYLLQALELALANVESSGGRPFGAVLVRDGRVLATGVNEIHLCGDPTAHAEMQALRDACRQLGETRLDGATLYASGHPCPMCLSALYLAHVDAVYYALDQADGEPYGLSTHRLYAELARPNSERSLPLRHLPVRAERDPYATWAALQRGP